MEAQRQLTSQERFWVGDFGDEYSQRNVGDHWVAANAHLMSQILRSCAVSSVLEIGANIGLNIRALQGLLPGADLAALEINDGAADELERTGCRVFRGSAVDFVPDRTYDLVFTKGVLIHINPEQLPAVYDVMYRSSDRYIVVAEYYSPRPESIVYRGESDRLFRRDFAGDLLDRFPDLELRDSGFAYHRGAFPQDDLTWFLLEKRA